MTRNRWYPTNTTLSTGDVLTTSGETEPMLRPDQYFPELWQNGNWVEMDGAPKLLPLYPWMFQAPNGKVFYAGAGPETRYFDPYYVNPATGKKGAWTELGTQGRTYNRVYGTAAMFAPGLILVAGGSDGRTVTNTTEIIDLVSGTTTAPNSSDKLPVITAAAPMRYARHHANATILPDGTVLVTGGSLVKEASDRTKAVLDAELWNPPPPYGTGAAGTGTWTTVAPLAEARMYHSTAVLLPDGRVLTAGGEEYNSARSSSNNHPNAEIYSPPYLSKGPRPVVTDAPAYVGYGQSFTVQTPDAARITRATLVRLSSVTHSFNMNQRLLPLSVGSTAGGVVSLTAPADGATCPPGHYLLFVLDANGVPSQGRVVAFGANPCAPAVAVGAGIVGATACTATAQATASGPGLGTDFRWFIDGVPEPAFNGQPTAWVTLDLCRPQVTFSVRVTATCGGEVRGSAGTSAVISGLCQCLAQE